jgi:hypothetical protein
MRIGLNSDSGASCHTHPPTFAASLRGIADGAGNGPTGVGPKRWQQSRR